MCFSQVDFTLSPVSTAANTETTPRTPRQLVAALSAPPLSARRFTGQRQHVVRHFLRQPVPT
ncbi:hypothetical protein FJZ31_06135 [Candidatus Poribacteria bacterium]|nr:hypothetical protein [Candidatus Poribacteria bacterium]